MSVVSPLVLIEHNPADLKPYHRQDRETDTTWAMFLQFRDMAYPEGPNGAFFARSLEALGTQLGLSKNYLYNLAGSHNWIVRAGAYDQDLDAARVEARIDEVTRLKKSHLRIFGKLRGFAEKELDKLIARANGPDAVLSPKELDALLNTMVKLERLITGQSTENVSARGQWDLGTLELDDLEKLKAIEEKAKGR